ncbi:MAG: phosphoenolpyruvate carboxykinase, partial [Candidatus Neomarinimicrobiota bacterium]
LFKMVLNKDYSRAAYEHQFTLRTDKLIAKLDRIIPIYQNESVPDEFSALLARQRFELMQLQERFQTIEINPFRIK